MANHSINSDTLARIEEKLDNITERMTIVESKVDTTIQKQTYTNGKVAGLIEDKIRREEREKVSKELAVASPQTIKDSVVVNKPPLDYDKITKLIISVIVLIGLIVGIIYAIKNPTPVTSIDSVKGGIH